MYRKNNGRSHHSANSPVRLFSCLFICQHFYYIITSCLRLSPICRHSLSPSPSPPSFYLPLSLSPSLRLTLSLSCSLSPPPSPSLSLSLSLSLIGVDRPAIVLDNPAFWISSHIPAFLRDRAAFLALLGNKKIAENRNNFSCTETFCSKKLCETSMIA